MGNNDSVAEMASRGFERMKTENMANPVIRSALIGISIDSACSSSTRERKIHITKDSARPATQAIFNGGFIFLQNEKHIHR
jgi:hypothetical protein